MPSLLRSHCPHSWVVIVVLMEDLQQLLRLQLRLQQQPSHQYSFEQMVPPEAPGILCILHNSVECHGPYIRWVNS